MKWRKYVPWLAVLLVLLIFGAYKAFWPTGWRFAEETLPPVQFFRQDVLRAEIRFSNLILSGHRRAADINRQLEELHADITAAYTERIEQLLDEAEFNGSLPKDPNQMYCYIDGYSGPLYAGKGYLSLGQGYYEYIYNAPHPMIGLYAYVFDMADGKLLSLTDIWGENARERAATEIYSQIEADGRLDDFYPGLKENLPAYLGENSWYMDDENIYIIYNPYDIGPYALGIVQFALPR